MNLTSSERGSTARRAAAARTARAKANAAHTAANFDWDQAITNLKAILNAKDTRR